MTRKYWWLPSMIRGITNISTLELQCYLQIKKKYYSLSFLHFNDQSEMSDSEVLINIFKKIMPKKKKKKK